VDSECCGGDRTKEARSVHSCCFLSSLFETFLRKGKGLQKQKCGLIEPYICTDNNLTSVESKRRSLVRAEAQRRRQEDQIQLKPLERRIFFGLLSPSLLLLLLPGALIVYRLSIVSYQPVSGINIIADGNKGGKIRQEVP